MPTTVRWVDLVPQVEVDGDGVKVTAASGQESCVSRMSRHTFRIFIERSRRMLDEADRAEIATVVPFKRG